MDKNAFEAALAPLRPQLRSYVGRLLANPADADDVVQDALAKAWSSLDTLRDPGAVRTWLFRIATRLSLDHLRRRKRWNVDAQFDGATHFVRSDDLMRQLRATTEEPGFRYDAREHIAYCFTCVGRSLPPEQQAALLLGEVFAFSGREAAQCLGLSESVYRHHLASARKHMRTTYEDRCALVRKGGACYQCSALRDECPPTRRGDAVTPLPGETPDARLDARIAAVAQADLVGGSAARLHALLMRVLDRRQQLRPRLAAAPDDR